MVTRKRDLAGITPENLERVLEDLIVKQMEPAIRKVIRTSMTGAVNAMPAVNQNGIVPPGMIKTPKKGGKCAAVWDELEKQFTRYPNEVPTLEDIMKVGKSQGWNENNTRVEYYAWRRHKGIHGRVVH